MATDNAAPGMMTLDRTDGSATLELYRAAIGPVHTAYYLKAFTRFDAAGKPGPSWNWTAALLSFNWLLFRQLWSWALAYVGAVAGTLLLLFGIGRLLFQLSDTSQWVLLALAVLLSFLVPGAYGNAWLYAACNKKMEAALVPAASLEEACAWLTQRAPRRKQQGILAASNLALIALLGGTVLSWPNSHELPLQTAKMEQARSTPGADLQSGLAAQNVAAAASAPAPAPAPAPAAASSAPATPLATPPQAAPSAVATRTSQGLVQAEPTSTPAAAKGSAPTQAIAAAPAWSAASTPALPAAKAASAPAAASSALAAAAPTAESTKPPPAKLTRAELRAKALQEKKEKLARAKEAKASKAAAAKSLAQEKSKAPATAAAPSPSPAPASAPASDKFLINVGLFADANNARNAYAKLRDAGLPALSQEIKSAKGVRTRVRVGPYDSQSEADRAAETIRTLQLDAAVVKP
ncbi:sporulation protein [Rhodoferax lacus]|uniref:Sporulation protein n=1 Tax=Rhodoferax lacus TaxID=2184758 RepID=A0A3E1R717_9BURK|nr:SPOR domain-containing protein [Rhodoferax lacus]RFO95107.1 sporulation protein [Rhodoferax lacus]